MPKIRTKRGVIRRYNAIVRQLYRDFAGGTTFGIDTPTLQILRPQTALKLRILSRLYRMLPE